MWELLVQEETGSSPVGGGNKSPARRAWVECYRIQKQMACSWRCDQEKFGGGGAWTLGVKQEEMEGRLLKGQMRKRVGGRETARLMVSVGDSTQLPCPEHGMRETGWEETTDFRTDQLEATCGKPCILALFRFYMVFSLHFLFVPDLNSRPSE